MRRRDFLQLTGLAAVPHRTRHSPEDYAPAGTSADRWNPR
jgi:hypothetical protein